MKVVYGSKTCHACKKLTESYNKDKVEFEYVDIDTLSNKELTEIAEKAGTMSLPIVIER